jgi:hypothetical protein
MMSSTDLPSIILKFLADPMTGAPPDAAAASITASPKPD